MAAEQIKHIITIGASAGGIVAVSKLLWNFNKNIDGALFIVIHVGKNSLTDVILHQIQKQTTKKCIVPSNGESILNNTIYLAPSDHHMMLEQGKIIITKGAYENHWRPSIDVLFRSAAAAYGACVTGIILTGLLDDGTSGMSAIKRSGGTCIVQDPEEAEFSDMPDNVLRNVKVDYKVSISEIGYILNDLFSRPEQQCETDNIPEDVKLEAGITMRMSSSVHDLEKLGQLTPLTCPECGGVMIRVANDDIPRYRCYTGHAFSEKSLEEQQIRNLEDSLWVAIRMMEERKNLLDSMSNHNHSTKIERAEQLSVHVDRLKKMLTELGGNTPE